MARTKSSAHTLFPGISSRRGPFYRERRGDGTKSSTPKPWSSRPQICARNRDDEDAGQVRTASFIWASRRRSVPDRDIHSYADLRARLLLIQTCLLRRFGFHRERVHAFRNLFCYHRVHCPLTLKKLHSLKLRGDDLQSNENQFVNTANKQSLRLA